MTRIRSIVLATRNPGKIRELKESLGVLPVRVAGLEEFGDIPEPQEHGLTFADNARDKAVYYARATGQWCLADDSGLVVDALDGQPGVRSARYAADQCSGDAKREALDQANNAKLLRALENIPDAERSARFVCHLALVDADGSVLIETSGKIEGRIGRHPQGQNGFGYDPLFYLPDRDCTTAQLPSDQKNQISHRGKAVREFVRQLKQLLNATK